MLLTSSSKLIPPPNSSTTPHRHPRHQHSTTTINTRTPTLHSRPTLKYYSDLSSKLAEDGRFTDFLLIAETLGLEFLPLVNEKSVAIGIITAVARGNVDAVVNVLLGGVVRLGIQPLRFIDGPAAFKLLREECRRLFHCTQLHLLLTLLETLAAGFQFPIQDLVKPSDVIKLCVNKRSITAATRYVRIFPHVEVLICSTIREFGMARDLVSALTFFQAYKHNSTSPNMHVYRTVIDACGLCGDYIKSRAIYEELLACNVTPNTYVFNSVMNVNARDLNYTLNIYKEMEKLGVTADITSYNILLKAFCLAAKVELAQDIYRQVKKLETNGALKLDVFTYSTIIKVFADAKMWRQAIGIKEEMLSSGVPPNTVTWSSLISACANAGLVEQAIQLFDEMHQAGVHPNTQCFNSLLHACTEARQYDRAFRLFHCWKETGFPQQIISNNNRSKLIKRIPFRPTASTYNVLMKACGTDYYRAKCLMDEMSTLGLSPNNVSWSILIDVCGGAGNVAGVMQILRSMREAAIQPDVVTYTTAIKVCVEHGMPKLAFSLFAEMKKCQISPNMVTYNIILRARTRYGSLQEVQQCLAIYQDMRKAGYKPNDYYLKQLIEEWCEGVIQNRDTKNCQSASRRTDFGPENLLLERVAEHLQDGNAKSLSIDLRGLTKLEARIVILAVLRKIKEKYIVGHHVKDDMLIILGVLELGAHVARTERSGVKEAVIRLLQHDLGIQVLSTGSTTVDNMNIERERCKCSNLMLDEIADTGGSLGSPARRPAQLQRLRVTRESLDIWLRWKNFVELRQ